MQIHTSNKIIAGLLGFAMVLTMVVGLAAVKAEAATYNFTKNLTIGSRGADVVDLQTLLVAEGYLTMPEGVAMGYFGSLTKSALAKYQAANGISPAAGYFGPITREFVNGNATGGTSTPGCPAGALFNSQTGAPCTTTQQPTLDNTDGSITATLSSLVGTGTTIKKGEGKDMLAVEFQATAGNVSVNRIDVRFDTRPWLYFSTITLKDSSGTVIATKNIGPSDFTEVTAGTDYLLRFDGLNYVVTPSSKKTVVVAGTVLPTTDKLTTNKSVIVSMPAGSIRTINGKGYTDSLGGSTITRTITLSSTGSNGNIVGRLNANSLQTRTVQTSTSGQTNGVEMMRFDLKSENQASTISALKLDLKNSLGTATTTVFKAVRLVVDGTTWNANSISSTDASGTTQFTGLNIALPLDTWKTLTVVADVADQDDFTAGLSASSSLVINTSYVTGVDANYNDITATASTVTGNDVTFLASAGSISNTSTTVQTISNIGYMVGLTQKFRFTNNSNSDLYIAKTIPTALATTSTASSSGLTAVSATLSNGQGSHASDTSTVYVIPSGMYRDFTYSGFMNNLNGTAGTKAFSIDRVYYDDDTTNLQEFNINYGLDNLQTAVTLTAS